MSHRAYITAFAQSFEHLEFSQAIVKWAPLIESTAYKVADVTRQDVEDTLQTLLLDLAAVADYHASSLYRYENRIWKAREKSGRIALIESPQHIVQRMEPRWVYWARLVPVRQASASAFVYRRIIQNLPNSVTKYFRRRNGFESTHAVKLVVERSGETRDVREREVKVPVQQYQHVDFADCVNVAAFGYNPEDNLLADRLLEGTSPPAQRVARILLTDGVRADTVLSNRTDLCVRQVAQAKVELYRRLRKRRYPTGCKPVYFRAEQIVY